VVVVVMMMMMGPINRSFLRPPLPQQRVNAVFYYEEIRELQEQDYADTQAGSSQSGRGREYVLGVHGLDA